MIKLFASDLDGTLLNTFHQLDATILRALAEVTASGAHFSVATGRTMRRPAEFGFGDIPAASVCANGSLVYSSEGELIYHGLIDPAVLEEMLLGFPGICFECVGLERTYVTGSREACAAGYKPKGLIERIAMSSRRNRANIFADQIFDQTPADVLSHEICKVNARTSDPALDRALKAFLAEHTDTVVNAPFDPIMFEISDVRVNKGASIARLAEYLGFTEDEVAVYGDGGNDIAMLERFEHAYATSNGSDDAKRAAGNVIGSCTFHAVPRHMLATVRAQRPGSAGYYVVN